MITRQRLGQLIKEEKFIYTTRLGGKKPEKFKLYKDFYMSQEDTLCCLNKSQEFLVCKVKFKYLFETKEKAEFALNYKRIPRTEYLDLPDWEEFNSEDKLVSFAVYPHKYHLLKVDNYIYLRSFYGQGGMDIFDKPLTKENYIKACELCKKLWLGDLNV